MSAPSPIVGCRSISSKIRKNGISMRRSIIELFGFVIRAVIRNSKAIAILLSTWVLVTAPTSMEQTVIPWKRCFRNHRIQVREHAICVQGQRSDSRRTWPIICSKYLSLRCHAWIWQKGAQMPSLALVAPNWKGGAGHNLIPVPGNLKAYPQVGRVNWSTWQTWRRLLYCVKSHPIRHFIWLRKQVMNQDRHGCLIKRGR